MATLKGLYPNRQETDVFSQQEEHIALYTLIVDKIMQMQLSIPNYQRAYCWDEENVGCLLNDIIAYFDESKNQDCKYRLGTIILYRTNEGKYDILDGQQRLITLALILQELGIYCNLLKVKPSSEESSQQIAYNKFFIKQVLGKKNTDMRNLLCTKILQFLDMNVLVIREESLDVAYTFFTHQNSRGKALTDYDLLKAHHLRFMPAESATNVAERWNEMINHGRLSKEQKAYNLPAYVTMLDTYLYHLRHLLAHDEYNDKAEHHVMSEFTAIDVAVEGLPENSMFFDSYILGGQFFFDYVYKYLVKFYYFKKTSEYQALNNNMNYSSHSWYCNTIGSLLFCYYLRFGNNFLAEALVVIMRIILQDRFDNARANERRIWNYARNLDLARNICRSSLSEFFLADALKCAKAMSVSTSNLQRPIKVQMLENASKINNLIAKNINMESFKNINFYEAK